MSFRRTDHQCEFRLVTMETAPRYPSMPRPQLSNRELPSGRLLMTHAEAPDRPCRPIQPDLRRSSSPIPAAVVNIRSRGNLSGSLGREAGGFTRCGA